MSDDDQRRPLDETGEYSPFEDEDEIRPIGGPRKDDRTEQLPRVAADADSTRILQAADDAATQVDATTPRSDATSVLPVTPADGTRTERYPRSIDNWADDDNQVWSARAGVRPPRPGYGGDDDGTDWAAVPADEPRGKWWTPIVVGIVGLLLLGLLGWGIYLIVQSSGNDEVDPGVTASAPAAPTDATTEPTTTTPSTPPSTQPTTTQPTTSPPAPQSDITVPALKGLSTEEARGALDRKGLNYRLRYVTSDSPAGTVIDSDPAEGQQVPADTVITLIIAAEPDAPATPTQTTTTGPAGEQDED
jgi:cell division septation protein DedD